MSKAANFSFVAELPTYKPARHCCGFVKITTLYFILTSFVTVQLVLIALCSAPRITDGTNPLGSWLDYDVKSNELSIYLAAIFSIWVVLAIISFAGLIKKNPYFHLPLLIVEFLVSFCLLSTAGVGWFLWKIWNFDDVKQKSNGSSTTAEYILHRAIFLTALFICHSYYSFVIYSLFADVKTRRDTDAFIARQKMLDEVCEEMVWEEEEKYNGNTSLPMSGVYYAESICYSNGSIASRELYYVDSDRQSYIPHQHPKRYVTYYDEDEESY